MFCVAHVVFKQTHRFHIFQVVWHGHAFDVVIKCVSNDAAQTTTHALTTVHLNLLHKNVHARMFWCVYKCIHVLCTDYIVLET